VERLACTALEKTVKKMPPLALRYAEVSRKQSLQKVFGGTGKKHQPSTSREPGPGVKCVIRGKKGSTGGGGFWR